MWCAFPTYTSYLDEDAALRFVLMVVGAGDAALRFLLLGAGAGDAALRFILVVVGAGDL